MKIVPAVKFTVARARLFLRLAGIDVPRISQGKSDRTALSPAVVNGTEIWCDLRTNNRTKWAQVFHWVSEFRSGQWGGWTNQTIREKFTDFCMGPIETTNLRLAAEHCAELEKLEPEVRRWKRKRRELERRQAVDQPHLFE